MLIEEMGSIPAFSLTSCDFSDKMLKHALKTRWDRRREQAFFDWTIEVGSCLGSCLSILQLILYLPGALLMRFDFILFLIANSMLQPL